MTRVAVAHRSARGLCAPAVLVFFVGGLAACSADPVMSFQPDAADGAAPSDVASPVDAGADVVAPDTMVEARDIVAIPTPDAASGGVDGEEVRVYAHTSSALFTIEPRSFSVMRVAAFGFPSDGFNHDMTDIAVNAAGEIWGITFEALYRVDAMTARCRLVATFEGATTNGLSFVPNESGGTEETLLAATGSGVVYRVDTRTGVTTRIGSYGAGRGSSGDIVSVLGAGTFATITAGGTEYLARVNTDNGSTELIGPTGSSSTWGLGYWRGRVYGFTASGQVTTIDITTGRATEVDRSSNAWWGAGVTTLAPTGPG